MATNRCWPAWVVAVALAVNGCGASAPVGPSGPKPGGTLTGRYALEISPASRCAAAAQVGAQAFGPVSIPVTAAQAGASPHPGVQLVLDGSDPGLLELELKYTDFTLEGGFGTTGDGVPTDQGPQLWVNAIGTGNVTQTSEGRGEVLSGSLRGYLEIEGINACTATDHAFRLRPR